MAVFALMKRWVCLQFEERYNNLMMAFKLFDIYNDGSVMRIDMRRVLSEFGMPVSAVQLGPLMHR